MTPNLTHSRATGCRAACAAVLVTAAGAAAQPIRGEWVGLGGGVTGPKPAVHALLPWDGGGPETPLLVVGGLFEAAGGVAASNIAIWDGDEWHALGAGTNGPIYALAVFSDGAGPALYAGGTFTKAGGKNTANIARWKGGAWSAVGTGMTNVYYAPAVYALLGWDDGHGKALFAAGDFATAGGVETRGIAKWTGKAWTDVGGGFEYSWSVQSIGRALRVFDSGSGDRLYVGGYLDVPGLPDHPRALVARWNGIQWSKPGKPEFHTDAPDPPFADALGAFDPDGPGPAGARLFVGGAFKTLDFQKTPLVASWDAAGWETAPGLLDDYWCDFNWCYHNAWVSGFADLDDGGGRALYAGGQFVIAGPKGSINLARWDGAQWHQLPGWLAPRINALAVYDDGSGPALYAAGSFQFAGPTLVNNIAWFAFAPAFPGLAGFEPPSYARSVSGVPLNGQRGWTKHPEYQDLIVHRYEGNPSGLPPNPAGGGQFAATDPFGVGQASLLGNTINLSGSDHWDFSFDFAGRFEGPMPEIATLARFVVHVVPDPGFRVMMDWDDPAVRDAFTIRYDAYTAGGERTTFEVGAPWHGLAAGRWIRVATGVDLDANRITSVRLTDLETGASWHHAPKGWYMAGGAAGSLPTKTTLRLAVGVGDYEKGGPGNLAGWDNVLVEPGAGPCFADCDRDGALGFFDFLCFQNAFAAGDPAADCDGDGALSAFDFLCFIAAFNAGCP